ncbi:MAG: glycosyltransferase family A protein [Elusimicrobiota bacterium]|nr:glycosyltransferase family 2 protein [Endomicrobiia bacterium]MDW7973211.1 glycosyltransferase family A protein [Thermodesulfovibrio sp.]MDW8166421.1 glycosyltransferase family A protein [Elusimicrobiota bacterium]
MIEISVIIPTRNRARLLKNVFESLIFQTIKPELFEVIVVDNGSTDNTVDICEEYRKKFKNFTYIREGRPGLHMGRHAGLKNAKAEILTFADDDIEAFPTWLEAILDSFGNKEVVLVGGKCLPKFECEPPNWLLNMWDKKRIIGYLSLIDLGNEVKEIDPIYVFGCNFSIRKEALLKAGGFHPDGMPEELIKYRGDGETYVSLFIKNEGYKAIYNPKASIYHFVPKERMTVEYFKRRAFLQGISDSYSDTRYGRKRSLLKLKMKTFIKSIFSEWSAIEQSYIHGYEYHQNEMKRDVFLREWVFRENYIDHMGVIK